MSSTSGNVAASLRIDIIPDKLKQEGDGNEDEFIEGSPVDAHQPLWPVRTVLARRRVDCLAGQALLMILLAGRDFVQGGHAAPNVGAVGVNFSEPLWYFN